MIWRSAGRRSPRITGLSSPAGGIQWENKPAEADVARRLLAELDDRRVLYNPSEAESPSHCAQSVIKIRDALMQAGHALDHRGVLYEQVRAMAAACRKFLDTADYNDPDIARDMLSWGHWRSWQFQDALGQLRGIFGVHIAVMAERFQLNIPDTSLPILPEAPYEDELNA